MNDDTLLFGNPNSPSFKELGLTRAKGASRRRARVMPLNEWRRSEADLSDAASAAFSRHEELFEK